MCWSGKKFTPIHSRHKTITIYNSCKILRFIIIFFFFWCTSRFYVYLFVMCVITQKFNLNKEHVTMVVYKLTKVKASVIYNIKFYHTFSSSEIPPAKERRPRRTHSSRALLSCVCVCAVLCLCIPTQCHYNYTRGTFTSFWLGERSCRSKSLSFCLLLFIFFLVQFFYTSPNFSTFFLCKIYAQVHIFLSVSLVDL